MNEIDKNTERPPAMVAPDVTVATFKAQLEKSKSEFGILTNVRGDIGLVFLALLEEQKDDESPRVVHLNFQAAQDLERMLRQTIRRIQK